jgi:flagellar protein FliS
MRDRYLADSVTTASPAKLLVMLYDRLLLDLAQAQAALAGGDREAGSGYLLHAQDIVIELRTSLRMDVWDGAIGLAKIYGFLLGELIVANVQADAGKVAACRTIVEPLVTAWREAALATISAADAAAGTAPVAAA